MDRWSAGYGCHHLSWNIPACVAQHHKPPYMTARLSFLLYKWPAEGKITEAGDRIYVCAKESSRDSLRMLARIGRLPKFTSQTWFALEMLGGILKSLVLLCLCKNQPLSFSGPPSNPLSLPQPLFLLSQLHSSTKGGEEGGNCHVFYPNKQLLIAEREEICLFDSL